MVLTLIVKAIVLMNLQHSILSKISFPMAIKSTLRYLLNWKGLEIEFVQVSM